MAAFRVTIISFAVMLICASCANSPRPSYEAHEDSSQYMTHTIAYSGETLAMIAKWYTGSAKNWQTILNVNPGLDTKRMRIGTPVRIPSNLVIKQSPMPRPTAAMARDSKTEGSIANAKSSEQVSPVEGGVPAQNDSQITKSQEEALKTQEAELKAEEHAIQDGKNNAANGSDGSVGALDSSARQGTNDQIGESDGTAKKSGGLFPNINNVFKKMGGVADKPASNDSAAQPAPALPPGNSNDSKVEQPKPAANTDDAAAKPGDPHLKTRDQLLKELTQDY